MLAKQKGVENHPLLTFNRTQTHTLNLHYPKYTFSALL